MSESNDDGGAQGTWYGDVSAETIGDIETNKWSGVEGEFIHLCRPFLCF
jgi:hypothetical protein